MRIEILGTGCAKCNALAATVKAAAENLGGSYQLDKVTDLREIMKRGVMMTPALVVNGEVKSSGKALSEADVTAILATEMGKQA